MAATDRVLHHSSEQTEINMLQAKMGGSEGKIKIKPAGFYHHE